MTITALYNAGAVRRWHTNPHMAHVVDTIDGHSGRVAKLILLLHPAPSMALIRAALTHDDGEHATGDVPYPAKQRFAPEFRAALDAMETAAREAIWGPDPVLTDAEALWLRYADRLDAYITAERAGAPMDRDGWPDALGWIAATAAELGDANG